MGGSLGPVCSQGQLGGQRSQLRKRGCQYLALGAWLL